MPAKAGREILSEGIKYIFRQEKHTKGTVRKHVPSVMLQTMSLHRELHRDARSKDGLGATWRVGFEPRM